MSYDFNHLPKKGVDNAPGLKKDIYIAPISWFLSIAEPTLAPLNPGDKVKITADHTFNVGKGFVKLYTTLDTSELTAETVGERDSRSMNPKVGFQHPGTYAEILEFADEIKNEEVIVLVEDLGGVFIQMGTNDLPAEISASIGTGKVSGGYKGSTFSAESFGKLYLYEGVITIKP